MIDISASPIQDQVCRVLSLVLFMHNVAVADVLVDLSTSQVKVLVCIELSFALIMLLVVDVWIHRPVSLVLVP